MRLEVTGRLIALTEQGFLLDTRLWDEQVALTLAAQEAIELTSEHWEILYFIRDYYQRYKHLPNARMFAKALAGSLGAEKSTSRYLQHLFPGGPLKYACKFAGLPKPPTCL